MSHTTFYKLDMYILAANYEISCALLSAARSFIISSRSVSTKAHFFLAQVKESPGGSLRINTICIFETMVNVANLKRLLKFLLLSHVDIQESYCKCNAKFNFLGIILESKRSWRVLKFLKQLQVNLTADIKSYRVSGKQPLLQLGYNFTEPVSLLQLTVCKL